MINFNLVGEEAYVSFETAKRLKEKGFDEDTIGYYNSISEIPERIKFFDSPISIYHSSGLIGCIQAPTQQMVMRWLRKVHNIKVNIFYSNPNYTIEYFEPNTQTGVGKFVFIGDGYDVYEQACEVAINYCLDNLI